LSTNSVANGNGPDLSCARPVFTLTSLAMAMSRTLARRWSVTLFVLAAANACTGGTGASSLTHDQADEIRKEIRDEVTSAYDLSQPNFVADMLSLYTDSGRVISATGGRILTTHDSLVAGLAGFWETTGSNMREPRWIWDQMIIDVLSPTTAVMTAAYHVPHKTPRGEPHVIAGAWTAVFVRQGGKWVIIQEHLSDAPVADTGTVRRP
jgi:ketosteroid isomerase-like protein